MATRAKNASQRPGYAQRKPRQPAAPAGNKSKTKKEEAAVAKAEKIATKRRGAAHVAKFEQEAMEREDMLNATPRPIFTSTADHGSAPPSNPSAPSSVIESEVDTNKMDPDKGTYKPGSTTKESSTDNLTAIPTSLPKRTYAKVASPQRKANRAATKVVESTDWPSEAVTVKLEGSTTEDEHGSTMVPNSVPLPPLATKPTTKHATSVSTCSAPKAKTKAVGPIKDSAMELGPPPPLAFNPKTPAPKKRGKQPSAEVSETESDSPLPKPKPRSLQRLSSYMDLGELDVNLRKAAEPPMKFRSGNRRPVEASAGADLKGKDREGLAASNNLAAGWKTWKMREVSAKDRMDLDLVEAQDRVRLKNPKLKENSHVIGMMEIIEEDPVADIERSSKKLKQKTGGEDGEDMEMREPSTMSKFILPTLPAGKGKAKVGLWPVPVPKHSHQNLDGNEALCSQSE